MCCLMEGDVCIQRPAVLHCDGAGMGMSMESIGTQSALKVSRQRTDIVSALRWGSLESE